METSLIRNQDSENKPEIQGMNKPISESVFDNQTNMDLEDIMASEDEMDINYDENDGKQKSTLIKRKEKGVKTKKESKEKIIKKGQEKLGEQKSQQGN